MVKFSLRSGAKAAQVSAFGVSGLGSSVSFLLAILQATE